MGFESQMGSSFIEIYFTNGVTNYINRDDLRDGMTLDRVFGLIQAKMDSGQSFYLKELNLIINCRNVAWCKLNGR